MNQFKETIENWADWGRVFQSIPAFAPLVESIFRAEGLPLHPIENLTPGTNAVFRVGENVIKIFSPAESGLDGIQDMETELLAMKFAVAKGVRAPEVAAQGIREDKYRFSYLVMEFQEGEAFAQVSKTMSDEEKRSVGRELREITRRLNVPCPPFRETTFLQEAEKEKRWDKYPESFRRERLDYIRSHAYEEPVFVHGDLNEDNILIDGQGRLSVLDFADAAIAPKVYEDALIAVELFRLDPAFLAGYFGNYRPEELARLCVDGLLVHPFGGDVIHQRIAEAGNFSGLDGLFKVIQKRLEE